MKKLVLLGFSALALFFASCSSNDNNPDPGPDPSNVITISGDITGNQTWTADKKYILKGFVYVTNGANLTIQPGTVIMGDKASKGTLTVTRGGKITAEGTVDKPIIFTSAQEANARREGDWGGLILLGKAPVNPSGGEAKIEGGLVPTQTDKEKDYIWFGGTDANDNSGTLKYVRIEFAGIAYSPDNEINGLTMGGVGAGTKISYVQVYRSGDDAFEWFGGTVNCDHLVASYSWDDDFDTDNGFSGNVQFGVALRVKTVADQSGSNGFESDNDANGSNNTPQTKAVFSNMTVVGPIQGKSASGINNNFQHGAQIRRNSSISIMNSIIMGFPLAGLYIDDTKGTFTSANAVAGTLKFANNIIAGCPVKLKATAPYDAAIGAWVAAQNNQLLDSTQQVGLADPFKFTPALSSQAGRPSFLLTATSPALTGANFTGMPSFQQVPYIGAFDGSADWTAGWTTWDAEKTAY
ncbi:hypothetical protein [Taibaiella helva]|uniref:hypothetical protein n=1 Tax=Taibaiella helva TaxID=2301235 RepID=UPI000E56B3A2|nr:hypothetical protein [Taibaiella helva]